MLGPTIKFLSEVYLQYLEHKTHYDILLRQHIISYHRYVDDILLVVNIHTSNIHDLLQDFNAVHPKLQFTLEEEEEEEEEEANNRLHFLEITIIRSNDSIQFNIYRKSTATDAIIHADSYNPNEHKQSVI
jgi:hypothetical protein